VTNTAVTPIRPVNILSREFKANPFPFYARLRAEAPVYSTKLPGKRTAWLMTRYDDVAVLLKDERFVKDRRRVMSPEQLKRQPWVPGFLRPLERNMLDLDDPDHRRLRTLVHKAFTPRIIEQMQGRVQTVADELLNAVESKRNMDVVKNYALPLPLTVITELLGVPSRDHHKFHRWSKAVVQVASTASMIKALPYLLMFVRYIRKLIEEKRVHPEDDLLTALVQAEEAGDKLSEDELLAMVFLLLIAGHETTVNLIASGTLTLLEHPKQLELLKGDPSVIKTATEELLRYTSPVETATERYAHEDVSLHGVTISKGELVLAVLASANRDEAQFACPDSLDLTRNPNRHLAFGQGVHYCLGAPLARLEGQIAISTLLRRLPKLRLSTPVETLRWRPTFVVRGLESLPVDF
jgi:cytochrome P450 PksS